MALKDVHDKLDEIPEQYQDLYTEKNGKFELTGIQGVKTQADVDRSQESLRKATNDKTTLREKLVIFGDGTVGADSPIEDWKKLHDETATKLDRIPELEAASKGKLDEAQIEEIVNRRVEGTIKSKLAPVERKLKDVTKERDVALEENTKFQAADKTRTIHDSLRKALMASKVLPDAQEDALLLGDRVFEIREDDGAVVTRDNIGITPGLDPTAWLTEIQEKRRHWWPESVGGGSKDSIAGRGGPGGANPWNGEEGRWNMTKQGAFVRQHGKERADAMAKAAGTTVGGPRPKPKTAATA